MRELGLVIADYCEFATTLRRAGHAEQAKLIEEFANDVRISAEDYLRFVGESDASLMAGKSVKWLRAQYPEWESQGHARKGEGARREYRMLVLPRRPNLSAAREAGRRAGRAA